MAFLNWEFWPSSFFYIPNIPFALYHSIKARSLTFFTAANPSIENSGIGTESKYRTMQLIPDKYLPKTVFHQKSSDVSQSIQKINDFKISFPLIVKPDIGFRGLLVKKINSEEELKAYLEKYPIDILIQEFLNEENECGIFYYRYPNQKKGKITSITLKEFLQVIGDGKSSLKELILSDEHTKNYLAVIEQNGNLSLNTVLKKGEKIKLSDIGNHSKGTKFINGNHLISSQLENTFNTVNKEITNWFYGRLDIKYNTFEELKNGKFKIIELNGILAEPTHIYDTKDLSYFGALKEMRKHWKHLYRIARINHQTNNTPYKSTFKLLGEVRKLKRYTKKIAKLSKLN